MISVKQLVVAVGLAIALGFATLVGVPSPHLGIVAPAPVARADGGCDISPPPPGIDCPPTPTPKP